MNYIPLTFVMEHFVIDICRCSTTLINDSQFKILGFLNFRQKRAICIIVNL